MAIQLFGNNYNPMATGNPMGQTYNPLQVANPMQPAAPRPVAAPRAVAPRPVSQPAPRPVAPSIPTAQPIQINPAYAQYVQTRPSPSNPGVLEYFNPQNGIGFSSPNDVINYLRTATGQTITNLAQLSAPQAGAAGATADPYQDFARSAAQAGLGVEEYLKFVTGGVSGDERNKINAGLGIPEAYKQLFTPAPKTQDLYNNAYSQAGLGDLKAKVEAKLSEVNRIQSLYTEKGGKINENPFLSEASRVGRLRVLDDKRLQEIGNLNNELQSMQDLYNSGVNEVNSVVSRSAQDFSNDQQTNALKLTYLQQQAEQQLQDLQGTKTQQAYKYLPDYLKAKAGAAKPDTIGNAETGFYRWNPTTSTFEQVIAPQTNPLEDTYKMLQIQKLKQEIAGGGNANELLSVGDAQTLGVPYGTTKGQAVQMGVTPTKPATDAQNSAAGYALRIDQSTKVLDQLESAIVGYNPAGFEAQMKLPSWAQSGNIQSYDQAARNFINAQLRRESGAAISIGEFQNAYQQYLPRPNDKPQVLAQKKQNRDAALRGLIQSAGSAYNTITGSGGVNPSDPLGLFNSAGNASASTPYLKTLGPVTGLNGSSLWEYGLDVDLKVGDAVKSPVSGTVIAAKPNGGFGNQVKIKTPDGKEVWLSHLDSGTVKVGQVIQAGQLIGYGGKTGNTIPGPGGDGSHLDITIKDTNGSLYSAPQVKTYLDKIYV